VSFLNYLGGGNAANLFVCFKKRCVAYLDCFPFLLLPGR
jgi:hypothetical protein